MKTIINFTYVLLIKLLIISSILSAESYFLEENFDLQTDKWQSGFYYSRDGSVIPADGNQAQNFTGGKLQLRGHNRLLGGTSWDRNGYWIGRNIFLTNVFQASPEAPFGFEIIRTFCDLDFEVDSDETSGDARRHVSVSIWLFEDNEELLTKTFDIDRSFEWEALENFVEFSDTIGIWGINDARKKISRYNGTEIEMDMGNVIGPDGRSWDISPLLDNDYNMLEVGSLPNNNSIGFKIINDSENLKFYINPDPDDLLAAYPNEWLLADSTPVTWSENMRLMIGSAQKANDINSGNGGEHKMDADFDDLVIRSAVTSVTASFLAAEIIPSDSSQQISLILSNIFSDSDAGINYIKIKKPAGISWGAELAGIEEFITVSHLEDNSRVELETIPFDTNVYPGNQEATVIADESKPDEIVIILGKIIKKGEFEIDDDLEIGLNIKAPVLGENTVFEVYVGCERLDIPGAPKNGFSTCGLQRAAGSPSLRSKAFPAKAYSSITPNEVVLSEEENSWEFQYSIRATEESGHMNITWAAIEIPEAFYDCIFSGFSSLLLPHLEVTFTNINSLVPPGEEGMERKFMVIDYSSANIISPNGFDVISFKVKGRVPEGGKYMWNCWVDGNRLSGESSQTGINSSYPDQGVVVMPAVSFSSLMLVTGTKISLGEDSPLRLYLNRELDYEKYRVAIYDPFGLQVKELWFESDVLEWKGKDKHGRSCLRGVYMVLVEGPKVNNKFKVVVDK